MGYLEHDGRDEPDPVGRRWVALRPDQVSSAVSACVLVLALTTVAIVLTANHAWGDAWSWFTGDAWSWFTGVWGF